MSAAGLPSDVSGVETRDLPRELQQVLFDTADGITR